MTKKEYREAADAYLQIYRDTPEAAEAPESLLKLGQALSALGEPEAACATLNEFTRKYHGSQEALMSRAITERQKNSC